MRGGLFWHRETACAARNPLWRSSQRRTRGEHAITPCAHPQPMDCVATPPGSIAPRLRADGSYWSRASVLFSAPSPHGSGAFLGSAALAVVPAQSVHPQYQRRAGLSSSCAFHGRQLTRVLGGFLTGIEAEDDRIVASKHIRNKAQTLYSVPCVFATKRLVYTRSRDLLP